ncbi:MAG TPA: sulfite exporter TauE/SafE family protein [Bacteroidales bacterium]|nr:sulfite exporter TauE/SafE family protein [Bacteroidales bacterium]HSA42984.1 sulfite exporter TauE/SafE family protein [Bacteroidales bacterium]
MSWLIALTLICSGLMVGFINTLAGGGTIISLSLFMFLGMDPVMANGTNRLAVLFQTTTSSFGFRRHRLLDLKRASRLGIPVAAGSLLGTWIAIDISPRVFELILAISMVFMMSFLVFRPNRWLKGMESLTLKKISPGLYFLFFIIGIYGGLIYVGVGYYLLAAIVLGAGYDLLRANAVKVWIVLLYVPFNLVIFMVYGQVDYRYGLVHAIGNIIGAWLATRFAVNWGVNFVRWVLILVILLVVFQTFGLFDVRDLIRSLL